MLEVIGFSLLSLLWEIWNNPPKQQVQLESIAWHNTAIFELPKTEPDPVVRDIVDDYLNNLSQQGINSDRQGVWLQSDWIELADRNGKIPVAAASLTKIATTLASIGKLGVDRLFLTKIYHTGTIEDGILKGDLIVEGDRDPFFVWEEAIALSNTLNRLGVREIRGNVLVDDEFYMNYQTDPEITGKLLKQGLDSSSWSSEVKQQFRTLPLTTPRPQLSILGEVEVIKNVPPTARLLVLHRSLPLVDILRQMNIYSNNKMAQMLADIVGGASAVADYGRKVTGVSPSEIQLINGSGLGEANRISPRAATKMLIEIERLLQPSGLEVTDIFPVASRDRVGTMQDRSLPQGIAIKTGTLDRVSALAGVIPVSEDRRVWFAVINNGWQIKQFRQQQDELLQELSNYWHLEPLGRSCSACFNRSQSLGIYLGDPDRNQIITY